MPVKRFQFLKGILFLERELSLPTHYESKYNSERYYEGPQTINVATCYFHLGNGEVHFSLEDRRNSLESESYSSCGPRLVIGTRHFSSIISTLELFPSTEGMRELAFTLFEGAQHNY